MARRIDLDFRPTGYFRPVQLEQYLLSRVKGAELRRGLRQLFEQGRHDEARRLVGDTAALEHHSRAQEGLHPMFMGGNYLPDMSHGEVEIARVRLESVTADVTCIYARSDNGMIRYRVVDEYDGETLEGPTETTSTQPLTLGELVEFLLQAWPLMDVLEMNFEDDRRAAVAFFEAESAFYPALQALLMQRVRQHYAGK